MSDAWANIPERRRSTVRSYINSENERDRDHAMTLCARYGLDYGELRTVILAEMVAESEALGTGVPRWWEGER